MVTMRDVASVMGVSVMTVSNAFNRPDQLSGELRQRILARAEKMGYAGPHAAARALRQGRSNAFGVVFPDPLHEALADPFTVTWLAGFAAAMEERRSSIVLMTVAADDAAGVDAVRNTSIDGVAASCAIHPVLDAARARGLPAVAGDALGECYVSIDEDAAGRDVADLALRLGHRRVWILLGPPGHGVARPPEVLDPVEHRSRLRTDGIERWQRLDGILAGLGDAAVAVLAASAWGQDAGRQAAALALDTSARPTFVVALSDALALGFLEAMAGRGLHPGRDVSVTGFDDVANAEAAGLTTVRQPIREKGRLSAALLLDPDLTPRRRALPHELVVRRSTGPAPQPQED